MLDIAIQFLETPPVREVNVFGFTRVAALYAIIMFALYCVVCVQRKSSSLAELLGMVVSSFPFVIAAWAAVRAVVPPEDWTQTGYYIVAGLGMAWPTVVAFSSLLISCSSAFSSTLMMRPPGVVPHGRCAVPRWRCRRIWR